MKPTTSLNSILTGTGTVMWIIGLLTAGSDSLYMPWINIMGLILFSSASLILARTLDKKDSRTTPRQKFRIGHSTGS